MIMGIWFEARKRVSQRFMMKDPFQYFNTSPEIIRFVVMKYVRFPLSLWQIEDPLHERGFDFSHEAIHVWWNRFDPVFAAEIRKRRIEDPLFSRWRWRLDEVLVERRFL